MDLRRLGLDGVVLLGRMVSAQEDQIALAPDLGTSLAGGNAWFMEFLKSTDEYARKNGLELPDDDRPREPLPDPKDVSAPILELDLSAAGISTVIWANGFSYDFGWVHRRSLPRLVTPTRYCQSREAQIPLFECVPFSDAIPHFHSNLPRLVLRFWRGLDVNWNPGRC
jgi:hypothetical protein